MKKSNHLENSRKTTTRKALQGRNTRSNKRQPPYRTLCLAIAAAFCVTICMACGGICGIASSSATLSEPEQTVIVGICLAVIATMAFAGSALVFGACVEKSAETPGEEPHPVENGSRTPLVQERLDSLGLTPKEMEVARLILQHKKYDEIASSCKISPRTVQYRASSIFRKAYVGRRSAFEDSMLGSKPEPQSAETTPDCGQKASVAPSQKEETELLAAIALPPCTPKPSSRTTRNHRSRGNAPSNAAPQSEKPHK